MVNINLMGAEIHHFHLFCGLGGGALGNLSSPCSCECTPDGVLLSLPQACHEGRARFVSGTPPSAFRSPLPLRLSLFRSDRGTNHGPDTYVRLGGFSDVPAAPACDDGRTDVPFESNAMQHRVEFVAEGDQIGERQI
jgi:hypothetical protein